MPNPNHDDSTHTRLEVQQEQNAKAIQALTKTVDRLATLMAKEDDMIKSSIAELVKSSALCQQRHSMFVERMNDKKEILDAIKKDIASKADKDSLKSLWKIVWAVIGSVFTGLGGVILYLIKTSITGG